MSPEPKRQQNSEKFIPANAEADSLKMRLPKLGSHNDFLNADRNAVSNFSSISSDSSHDEEWPRSNAAEISCDWDDELEEKKMKKERHHQSHRGFLQNDKNSFASSGNVSVLDQYA